MLENSGRSEASDYGKVSLINHLGEYFTLHNPSSKYGIENHGSVISFENKLIVVASQLFVEDVHFDLGYFPLKHLGYKIVAAARFDILSID